MFNCSPVFQANYEAKEGIIINQGGTDSGKTYALMQLLYTRAITFDAPALDPIISVVAESIPNLKKGAYRHAKNIYLSTPELRKYVKSWNETDRVITFITGWIMEFISCENEQSAKQGKRQYLFVNEAQGISYLVFWQLAKRTRRQVYIDYNPSYAFWPHEKLIGTDKNSNDLATDVRLIISDHRHNPFLSEHEHFRTENIKDPDLWAVYARGKTGNLKGLIFPNWKVIDPSEFPDQDFIIGIDYGYTNDPTAIVKVAWIGENVFIKELAYSPGISAKEISVILKANGVIGNRTKVYTEHDPDMNAQLGRLGFYCSPTKKGAGSIVAGITKLKEYNIFYTSDSINLDSERKKYMWEQDKNTGKSLNIPIDAHNHLMDAIRYAIYTHFYSTHRI
jgi:phage terminase large subunit